MSKYVVASLFLASLFLAFPGHSLLVDSLGSAKEFFLALCICAHTSMDYCVLGWLLAVIRILL